MNQKMINTVKEELLQNIKCQSCGVSYEKKDIQIKSLGGNKSFITANCEKCGVCTEFQADIMEQEDMEKKFKNEIDNGKFKTLEKGNEVDYKESDFSKEFEEIKNERQKFENISNSVIKDEEISKLTSLMQNFSSFKNFFSIALVFSFIFTGCADTAEENRQNILDSINSAKTQFEVTKDQVEEIYKDGKVKFNQAKELIESAPEKIEKAKADIEKITADAIKLKEDLEQKVENTKKAIDETKKAVDAVSDAMDSINAITGKSE